MVVIPAFALPIMRTRNCISGIRGPGCWVLIRMTLRMTLFAGKARVVDRFDSMIDDSHDRVGSPSL